MQKFVAAALAFALVPMSAQAQTSRYNAWSDPAAQAAAATDLQTFRDRLNKLIDEAEKARAADPNFLLDLRKLANGVTDPYPTTLLDDAFTDGNYTANPTWQVLSGEYFIESGWGLRNRILSQQSQTAQINSGDDLAKALLGGIIKRAAGVPNTQSVSENVIATKTPIPNAFSVALEVSSWQPDGHFEAGVYQGQDTAIGYRLIYATGKTLQLVRVGSRGSSVLQTSNKTFALEDKKSHALAWTRSADGTMKVTLDGTEVLSVVDRGFSDPFDGLRLSDKGGDFIVKRVTVKG